MTKRRILVIGSGGREAEMVWKLAQNPSVQVFCAPGNAGIALHATCVPIRADDLNMLLTFAFKESIDLTIVGPELPLVAGITDLFREEGLLICGPSAAAARAEGSKAWFKLLLKKNLIPTAPAQIFSNAPEATIAYVASRGPEAIVIKASGLMGGKGVVLPNDMPEAERTIRKWMVPNSPGETIVIEDRLKGTELSLMAFTDGRKTFILPYTQDYKRERNGDQGPNTGGMGAHTRHVSLDFSMELGMILSSVLHALKKEGCPYSGFIYLGIMITDEGPKVLECNCRLGDPETQVILPSISDDFAELCFALARGDLTNVTAPMQTKQAVCVVLTSEVYPESSTQDDVITGFAEAEAAGALILHAGTASKNGAFTTNKSGRVLNCIGVHDSLEEARAIAYRGAEAIKFPGKKYRTDIG